MRRCAVRLKKEKCYADNAQQILCDGQETQNNYMVISDIIKGHLGFLPYRLIHCKICLRSTLSFYYDLNIDSIHIFKIFFIIIKYT